MIFIEFWHNVAFIPRRLLDMISVQSLKKHYRRKLWLLAAGLTVFAGNPCAQGQGSPTSAEALAEIIASDAGASAENYLAYAQNLALGLNHLTPAQRARIFGPGGQGDGGGTTSFGDSSGSGADSGSLDGGSGSGSGVDGETGSGSGSGSSTGGDGGGGDGEDWSWLEEFWEWLMGLI